MKKFLSLFLLSTLFLGAAACGNSQEEENTSTDTAQESREETADTADTSESADTSGSPEAAGSSSLIVYFSWSGNTEAVATEIQAQTGADIFELTPAEPYTDDYGECDLSGKTVMPFVTSGGSGFSNTLATLESMEPDAVLLEGLALGSSEAEDSGSAVSEWLEQI